MRFEDITFRSISHLAMSDEHCVVKVAEGVPFSLKICIHTPCNPRKKPYTHYLLNGKVYKTEKAFTEALEAL